MNPNVKDEPRGGIEDEGEGDTSDAPPLQTGEDPAVSIGTHNVMRRFNRNTTWVATGLLGALICGAMMLAIQEPHPSATDLAEEAIQNRGKLLPSSSPAAPSEIAGSSGKGNVEINPAQLTNVDHAPASETGEPDAQVNASLMSPENRQESEREIAPKIHVLRKKSFRRPRLVDVKMRLLALWHQSLARRERSRTWTFFSNLNKPERKKVGYNAEMSH